MSVVLIAGVDSVAGSSLAAGFVNDHDVYGVAFAHPVTIAGCHVAAPHAGGRAAIDTLVADVRPDWIVYCGATSASCWESSTPALDDSVVESAGAWAAAARTAGAHFTLISSDGVFAGPWMFHDEGNHGFADGPAAGIVRDVERAVLANCPQALVVRTHAYGFASCAESVGWIDEVVAAIESGHAVPADPRRRATPIHGSHLAEIVQAACADGCTGVLHAGGGERIDQVSFVRRLAEALDLPAPRIGWPAGVVGGAPRFEPGETSLRSGRVRRELGIGCPPLRDGLQRLRDDWESEATEPWQTEPNREPVAA